MRECMECGFPLDEFGVVRCPKCDGGGIGRVGRGILEVDVAHAGETWEEARGKIREAVERAHDGAYRGVKIVHGYGSMTGQSVIGPRATAYLRHLAEEMGGRYTGDRRNRGASVIWLSR